MRVKLFTPTAKPPQEVNVNGMGTGVYFLYLDQDVEFKSDEIGELSTGVGIDIPAGKIGVITAHKNLVSKNIRLANCVTYIPHGFKKNIKLDVCFDDHRTNVVFNEKQVLFDRSTETFSLKAGDPIGLLVLMDAFSEPLEVV